MEDDAKTPESKPESDARESKTWRQPKVSSVSIKQVTRGGMMLGFDMMGRRGMMMAS